MLSEKNNAGDNVEKNQYKGDTLKNMWYILKQGHLLKIAWLGPSMVLI